MHVKGKVIQGKKMASKIGFPTANIDLGDQNVLSGIYAGKAEIDGIFYKAALYVGKTRPGLIEVHVLDFEGDLYDKEISVQVCDKIRDDFDIQDEDKLKEIIQNDIEMIRIELDNSHKCLQE